MITLPQNPTKGAKYGIYCKVLARGTIRPHYGRLTLAYRKLAARVRRQEAVELGIQALLRDRMIRAYNHYTEKGYCPIYARENVEELYHRYHDLGGNGTITGLIDKLRELPTEEEA